MKISFMKCRHLHTFLPVLLALFIWQSPVQGASEESWWNSNWSVRKKITIDAGSTGVEIKDPIGATVVLLRLYDGNFNFISAREDGSDIRFVAEDGKTLLPYSIERFDSLLSEGFVWVKLPEVKSGGKTVFWLYYGNTGDSSAGAPEAKSVFDSDTILAYHFSDAAKPPVDASPAGNNASTAVESATASIIGGGLRFDGNSQKALAIPATPSLAFSEGGSLTLSFWFKPNVLQPGAVLFSRSGEKDAFIVRLDNGIPHVEVVSGGSVQKTSGGNPVVANSWNHLVVAAEGPKLTLYLNGTVYATLSSGLPALNGALLLGGQGANGPGGFNGEIDELNISKIVRSPGFVAFASASQSGEQGARILLHGEDEVVSKGGALGQALEHIGLFGDIAKNMMFDGWVVIFFCALMAVVGWTVAVKKFLYLKTIAKGSEEFLRQWRQVSTDLTALDHSNVESVKSLGGTADARVQKLMKLSPIYHIYHIGSEEIHHRIRSPHGFNGLSARSIQAIRASLDTGMTHEIHRLNRGLIFLTISIAGGPYLGLLGTVIGVMVTFAVIAKSGQVEVNSIAPGIAGALLATVAGLLVAIPALFIYSFLNSQIKDAISNMQTFINEFISKMAEFYPPSQPNGSSYEFARESLEEEVLR
jgi:biopolymer transport protein ExbB